MNEETISTITHIVIVIMDIALVVLLFLNRNDRLNYEHAAKSEREYIIQLFSQAVSKMSELIARVEEQIENGKH